MARVLHLDCFSGIAGNMLLGALLDTELSRKALTAELAGLGIDYKLVVRRVTRGAGEARHVEVPSRPVTSRCESRVLARRARGRRVSADAISAPSSAC